MILYRVYRVHGCKRRVSDVGRKEKRLIKQVKSGNEAAFRKLYELYASYALRTAYAIIKDSTDASDVVQETFIRVYRNIHTFDQKKSFRPWFYRILINESKRFIGRRNKHATTIESEETLDALRTTDNKQPNETLIDALDQLPKEDQILVTLKYVDRFTEKELAQMMELNVNTVKSRLSRTRSRLRELYLGGGLSE